MELRSNPGNQWLDTFLEHEDLAPEGNTHKAVYLVTLPHPTTAMTGGSSGLKAPGTLSRAQVLAIFQDVFAKPVHVDGAAPSRSGWTKHLIKVVVFQERHAENANGEREIRYHVALCASSSFRFQPYKRALRERHGLASHWSTSHHGYWSTVRYGWLPTPKKPSSELDPKPIAWNRDGPHPDLFEAAQEPVTAEATRRRREVKVKTSSEHGKPEPKATELDLYAVVVLQGFRNTPDDPWATRDLLSIAV